MGQCGSTLLSLLLICSLRGFLSCLLLSNSCSLLRSLLLSHSRLLFRLLFLQSLLLSCLFPLLPILLLLPLLSVSGLLFSLSLFFLLLSLCLLHLLFLLGLIFHIKLIFRSNLSLLHSIFLGFFELSLFLFGIGFGLFLVFLGQFLLFQKRPYWLWGWILVIVVIIRARFLSFHAIFKFFFDNLKSFLFCQGILILLLISAALNFELSQLAALEGSAPAFVLMVMLLVLDRYLVQGFQGVQTVRGGQG